MILIRKVAEEHGWLGNMAAFAVESDGFTYRTTEALFQSLRFADESIRKLIRSEKSPMAAKMIAKKYRNLMVVDPMSAADVQNMRLCLKLKLDQHSILNQRLTLTGEEVILEDCTKRPRGSGLFWGAAMKSGVWMGENWLGRLWMEFRADIRTKS